MVDTIKAVITYGTAALMCIGGILILAFSNVASEDKLIIGTLVGGAATFLFNSEVQTRTARQTQVASAAGAAQSNGHTVHSQP